MRAIAGVIYRDSRLVNDYIQPMVQMARNRCQDPIHTHVYKNVQLGFAGGRFGRNDNETIQVAFDGHLFNVEDLRSEIKHLGHRISTEPADVIAAAYEVWGINCIAKLDGDFALAILDQTKDQLLLARDCMGKQPLYWFQDEKHFLFGSDLKILLASGVIPQTPSKDALAAYLFLGYFPQEMTPIQSMNKLLPAHTLLFDLNNHSKNLSQYWSYTSFFHQDLNDTPQEIAHNLNQMLKRAVERRMPHEATIGCLISGGLGSSSIAFLANKLKRKRIITGFTFGFSGENEADVHAATAVAEELGLAHELDIISPEHVMDDFVRIIWHLGEPLADPNVLSTWHISRLASSVTSVVLSGMGSDEILEIRPPYIAKTASTTHSWLDQLWQSFALHWLVPILNRTGANSDNQLLQQFKPLTWQAEFLEAKALFDAKTLAQAAPALRGLFNADLFLQKFPKIPELSSKTATLLYFDVKTRLPDSHMLQCDRLAAAHNLNWETPFLEKEIVEYLAKVHVSQEKNAQPFGQILKDLMRGQVPDSIINRPQKTRRSLNRWATAPVLQEPFQKLTSGTLVQNGLLSKTWINKQLASPETLRASFPQLWALMALETWYKLFIEMDYGQKMDD